MHSIMKKIKNKSNKYSELFSSSKRYINREISWLSFNERVLDLARDKDIPLLERVKFLAISSSNLDEFYMIRVASIKRLIESDLDSASNDHMTSEELLESINFRSNILMEEQQNLWKNLFWALNKHGLEIISPNSLDKNDSKWLFNYFDEEIQPLLNPLAIDNAHPFPKVSNLGINLILKLRRNRDSKVFFILIPIPVNINRFILLPGKKIRYILIEELIIHSINRLFYDFTIRDSSSFRVVRDSELEFQDDTDDLVFSFQNILQQRRRGNVVLIEYKRNTTNELKQLINSELSIDPNLVISSNDLIGLTSINELKVMDNLSQLNYPKFRSRFPERIIEANNDIFKAIDKKDLIVHHPYETFEVVAQFLRSAAEDPNVITIKQTLYRTSKENSPIVMALIDAALSGKTVTALVELKARFDEESNIKVARDLERAGVNVVYGFIKLKTHAKMALVTRRHNDRLTSYAHVGTGNYNPETANLYSDVSLFTRDQSLCNEISKVFSYVTGYAEPNNWDHVFVAPLNLRQGLESLINNEIEHAIAGRPASIWIKCNSIVDENMIDLLYKAGKTGVKIQLIIRGICCLRAQIPGFSENIKVKSIVGRFLEHTRIFCFGNGSSMLDDKNKVYISSADLMPRNLDRRCEVMIPIYNKTVHQQLLRQIMVANLNDTEQSWEMDSKGIYKRLKLKGKRDSAHQYFIDNPSLSGRGKALLKNQPQIIALKKFKK